MASEDTKKDEAQARLDRCGVKPGQIYRHYKGGLYTVVAVGIKEDTLEPMVVYHSNKKGTTSIRTLENWRMGVDVDAMGALVPRFQRVAE
jgi:hypothetical protein